MANESDIPPQDETVTLPVVQESLHVGTRPADTGRGVRVRKHVRSQPHEVDQTVWHDELDVRHVPVDRVVSAPPAARYEGDTFIVPVLEEVLVVEKRYRIKEELHITRLRRAGRHRQTVPLRAEHVTVERFDDGNGGPSPLTKEATMTHTLAAIFEHRGDADRAKAELINAGFSGSAVRLASGAGTQTQADTGPGADDSIGGSIMHFFNSLFGTDDNADKHYYSSAVNRGNTVLTVDAASDDEIDRASGIIEGFGPLNIEEQQGLSAQAPPPAYQGAAGSLQDAGTAAAGVQAAPPAGAMQGGQSAAAASMQRATMEQQAIPVIQEEFQVGKRTVQRGGVRVFQRVIETPVQQDVTLREEHVTVERRPVDQAIHPDQVPAFQEKTFELRESAEEAVVQKSARVVEEVVVGKEVSERQEQVSDTVRGTRVEVEQLAPDLDSHFRSHWQSNYASGGGRYEDYDPAYRYGWSMASDAAYRGRPWNDVEPELRSHWESRYPQSAWDTFKAAIREGWDRMTS